MGRIHESTQGHFRLFLALNVTSASRTPASKGGERPLHPPPRRYGDQGVRWKHPVAVAGNLTRSENMLDSWEMDVVHFLLREIPLLLFGLAGGAYLHWMYTKKQRVSDLRQDVLHRLIAYRYLLTDLKRFDPKGEPFIAINEVPVAFCGCGEVIEAWKDYRKIGYSIIKLFDLVQTMAKELKLDLSALDRDTFENPATPGKY